MESEFDRHTALRRRAPGVYAADLSDGWTVGAGVNGGYLLAVLGSAVCAELPDRPDPLALSAHFVAPAVPGPADVIARVVRRGGSVATAAVELRQGEGTRISALATYGDLGLLPDDVRTTAEAPALPPVEECISGDLAPPAVRAATPIMQRFDLRFDPACVGWAVGRPSGVGMLQAWFRLADWREPDPLSLLMVVDALPPVTFDLGMPGWAPTLELTVHVRARPAAGWLRVRHEARNVAGGLFEEDCEVWDSAGRLVAQSRQLAMLPR